MMEVNKEMHVDDVYSFFIDDRAEFERDLQAYYDYQAMTPEEQAEVDPAPTMPDRGDYDLSDDALAFRVVKLTFNRPRRICMYGLPRNAMIAFENTFVSEWYGEGQFAMAGAMDIDGQVVIKCIKDRSPVIYIKTSETGLISVYAEK